MDKPTAKTLRFYNYRDCKKYLMTEFKLMPKEMEDFENLLRAWKTPDQDFFMEVSAKTGCAAKIGAEGKVLDIFLKEFADPTDKEKKVSLYFCD